MPVLRTNIATLMKHRYLKEAVTGAIYNCSVGDTQRKGLRSMVACVVRAIKDGGAVARVRAGASATLATVRDLRRRGFEDVTIADRLGNRLTEADVVREHWHRSTRARLLKLGQSKSL